MLSETRGEGDGGDSIHFRRSVQGSYLSKMAAASSTAVPSTNIRNAPPLAPTLNAPVSPSNRRNVPTKNHSSTPKKNSSSLRSTKRNPCNYYELKQESTPRRNFHDKYREFRKNNDNSSPGFSDRYGDESRDKEKETGVNAVGSLSADSLRGVALRKGDDGVEVLISSVVAEIFVIFESTTFISSVEFGLPLIETMHQSVMKQVIEICWALLL